MDGIDESWKKVVEQITDPRVLLIMVDEYFRSISTEAQFKDLTEILLNKCKELGEQNEQSDIPNKIV